MSHRIGRNNARNRANRTKKVKYHIFPGIVSGDMVVMKSGRKYRIGEHGEWRGINL